MFNLIVGCTDGSVDASRMLEYTPNSVKEYVAPDGSLDPSRLLNLPTLVMPETGNGSVRQVAKIGRIEHLTLRGNTYRFRFTPTPGVPELPTGYIEAAARALGMDDWEFTRTHWAVKDSDLYAALFGHLVPAISPRVFRLPTVPPEGDLVSVMMPFDAAFDPVYEALKDAVTKGAGMRCQRADDIWLNEHVMDDIASLIWRSRIVISDLTGKNPNVFYETGIAHTIGRDVIQITQAEADIPFDLRHIRHVNYLSNGEGLVQLKSKVAERIRVLVAHD